MNVENPHLCEFGKFRLDPLKKTLWHDGQTVSMPLKELELLCVLIENRGELVTKQELLDKVWEDSFVEESNLSRHIYLLRKTFKKFGGNEDLIQNIARRGYRFTGDVCEIANCEVIIEKHTSTRTLIEIQEDSGQEPIAQAPDEKRRTLTGFALSPRLVLSISAVAAALLGVVYFFWDYPKSQNNVSASEIKSLAVLPFKTINAASENEHQGLGLADVLITRLSNARALNVRPTSAISAFENQDVDSVKIGQKLNVDAVLEGTIYRSDKNVRVTVQLVKTVEGKTVWSGEFEKPLNEELKLESEIGLRIANALALNLSAYEQKALAKNFTVKADAYQLYMNGRYEWNKRSWVAVTEAERLFRNAIAVDPDFALAYVGLADRLATQPDTTEAEAVIAKALELDPNLAEAYATQGFLRMFHQWKWREAEESFKRSLADSHTTDGQLDNSDSVR